jgi:hypothetical protein
MQGVYSVGVQGGDWNMATTNWVVSVTVVSTVLRVDSY